MPEQDLFFTMSMLSQDDKHAASSIGRLFLYEYMYPIALQSMLLNLFFVSEIGNFDENVRV